jgi:hypothetical protein
MRVNFPWGWVDVRPIPGYVQLQLRRLARFPTIPLETVSGLGGTETLPARPGTEAFRNYNIEFEQAQERLEAIALVFSLGMVEAWEKNGIVMEAVPDDWACPPEFVPLMPRAIIGECPEIEQFYRKAEYLLTSVLLTPDDVSAVVQAALNIVGQEDVESAKALFRSESRGKTGKKKA